jgi:hypothetical protein
MFSKLAEVTGNKFAKTAIQTFQSMQTVFQALVSLNDITQQWGRLCDTSSSQALFGSLANVSARYGDTCLLFGVFRADYLADLARAESEIASLVLALVKLDNAIAADP